MIKSIYKVAIFIVTITLLIATTAGCKSEPKHFSANFPEKEIDFTEKDVYDNKFIRVEPIKVNTKDDEIKILLRMGPSEKLLSMGFDEFKLPNLLLKISKDGENFEDIQTSEIKEETGNDEKGDYRIITYKVQDFVYDKKTKFRMCLSGGSAWRSEDRYYSYDKDDSMVLKKYDDLGIFKLRSIEEVNRKKKNIVVKVEFITKHRYPIIPYFNLVKESGEELEMQSYSGYSTYEQGMIEGRTYYFESESGLADGREVKLHMYKLFMYFVHSSSRYLEFEI
ncbi:hypothetical protein R9X47_27915 [Wukongibacter baidiensis]|uniref:hypothetical protein n=1 Tax=Wukongibacter baidiensis TaxID=1723361 RepID=UPI003D7F40C5